MSANDCVSLARSTLHVQTRQVRFSVRPQGPLRHLAQTCPTRSQYSHGAFLSLPARGPNYVPGSCCADNAPSCDHSDSSASPLGRPNYRIARCRSPSTTLSACFSWSCLRAWWSLINCLSADLITPPCRAPRPICSGASRVAFRRTVPSPLIQLENSPLSRGPRSVVTMTRNPAHPFQ